MSNVLSNQYFFSNVYYSVVFLALKKKLFGKDFSMNDNSNCTLINIILFSCTLLRLHDLFFLKIFLFSISYALLIIKPCM